MINISTRNELTNLINDTKSLETQIKSQFDLQVKAIESPSPSVSRPTQQTSSSSETTLQQRAMLSKLSKDFDRIKAMLTTIINESQQFKVQSNNDSSTPIVFSSVSSSSSSSNSSSSSTNTNTVFNRFASTTASTSTNSYMGYTHNGDMNSPPSEWDASHRSLEMKLIPSLQGEYIHTYMCVMGDYMYSE